MQAVSVERACIFLSAVACLVVSSGSGGGGGVIDLYRCGCIDVFVMVIDHLFRVVHAAVADLDGVPVEDFSELVIFGKVFVY